MKKEELRNLLEHPAFKELEAENKAILEADMTVALNEADPTKREQKRLQYLVRKDLIESPHRRLTELEEKK